MWCIALEDALTYTPFRSDILLSHLCPTCTSLFLFLDLFLDPFCDSLLLPSHFSYIGGLPPAAVGTSDNTHRPSHIHACTHTFAFLYQLYP